MPGRIDNIDTVLLKLFIHSLPETGGCSRGDGDPTLLLLLHPVHGRRTIMYLAYFVRDTGVEQNPFRSRRLAGVDVRHDAKIAITVNGGFAGHWIDS